MPNLSELEKYKMEDLADSMVWRFNLYRDKALREKQKMIDNLHEENRKLEIAVHELRCELSDCRSHLRHAKQANEALTKVGIGGEQEQIDSLVEENRTLSKELGGCKEEVSSLRHRSKMLEETAMNQANEAATLRAELEGTIMNLRAENDKLVKDIANTNEANKELIKSHLADVTKIAELRTYINYRDLKIAEL